MAQGTGKRYNAGKGYGFIAYDGGTPDVFLHKPAIEADGYRNLQDCQRVAYTITRNAHRWLRSAGISPLCGSCHPVKPKARSQPLTCKVRDGLSLHTESAARFGQTSIPSRHDMQSSAPQPRVRGTGSGDYPIAARAAHPEVLSTSKPARCSP